MSATSGHVYCYWQRWTCTTLTETYLCMLMTNPLLAIKWGNETYVDTALPFGLRSAPKIFAAVAYALAWIMSTNGVTRQLHYFLILGPPNSNECAASLQSAVEVCRRLGVPVASHKTEGPTTRLTFPWHTEAMQLSLAQEKFPL